MKNCLKRRYKSIASDRRNFKNDLRQEMKTNKALAMVILETYRANKYSSQVWKTTALLGKNHREAFKDYCDKLAGEMLCGSDEIWNTLYFSGCEDIREKYIMKIPEPIAMGDALGIAYRYLDKV